MGFVTNKILDEVAESAKTASLKNAAHACRHDNPLGKNESFKYRNLWMLASLQEYPCVPHLGALRRAAYGEVG